MHPVRPWIAVVLMVAAARADGTVDTRRAGTTNVPPARDAQALTARIDAVLAARWAEGKIRPATVADDGEFLRRVSLDLIGKIPTAAETRDFLDDPSKDKRSHPGRTPARQPGLHDARDRNVASAPAARG